MRLDDRGVHVQGGTPRVLSGAQSVDDSRDEALQGHEARPLGTDLRLRSDGEPCVVLVGQTLASRLPPLRATSPGLPTFPAFGKLTS